MSRPIIFFDWDGTLCDSMELCIKENRTTLLKMGLPDRPDEVLRQCNGPTFEEAAPILGVPADRMDEYCRIRLDCALALVPRVNRLFPGAREMLMHLRGKAGLCIVSNGTQAYLTQCMRQFGLEGVFHRMAWSRPGYTKAANLTALMAELQPEQAVMVGDRLGDIRAGQENGLPTIAAAFGYGSDAEYDQADARANTMAELQTMLLRFITKGEVNPHVD